MMRRYQGAHNPLLCGEERVRNSMLLNEVCMGECEHCGEFDCELDHDDDIETDESWFFDGSGMIGDD
jgi:hypothetical protein